MERALMVKQRYGEIPETNKHPRFEVFESGDPKYIILAPMHQMGINNFCSGTLQFPVKKSNLKRGWRKLLV